MKTELQITTIFEEVPEGYIGYIPEISGVNTQGATLEEVKANLFEALKLILTTRLEMAEESLKDKKVIKEKVKILA